MILHFTASAEEATDTIEILNCIRTLRLITNAEKWYEILENSECTYRHFRPG